MKSNALIKTDTGFTLTEVLLTVVIISILTSMALPQYVKTVERAHERDAEANLMAIHAANRIFFTKTGSYFPPPAAFPPAVLNGPGGINETLRLSIVPNGFTYQCSSGAPGSYGCSADRNGGAYRVSINEGRINPGFNPRCIGACP